MGDDWIVDPVKQSLSIDNGAAIRVFLSRVLVLFCFQDLGISTGIGVWLFRIERLAFARRMQAELYACGVDGLVCIGNCNLSPVLSRNLAKVSGDLVLADVGLLHELDTLFCDTNRVCTCRKAP